MILYKYTKWEIVKIPNDGKELECHNLSGTAINIMVGNKGIGNGRSVEEV
jgi:hypothetical protein